MLIDLFHFLQQDLGLPFGQGFKFSRFWFKNYHSKRPGQNVTLGSDEYKLPLNRCMYICINLCNHFFFFA